MDRNNVLMEAPRFKKYKKPPKKEKFLTDMECVVPWKGCSSLACRFRSKPGKGRLPQGLERMLRIQFFQNWLNISEPGAEDFLCGMESVSRIAGISIQNVPVPVEAAMCRLSHIFEAHGLRERLFEDVDVLPEKRALDLPDGIVMDAVVIDAPSSKKCEKKSAPPCIPQRRRTRTILACRHT